MAPSGRGNWTVWGMVHSVGDNQKPILPHPRRVFPHGGTMQAPMKIELIVSTRLPTPYGEFAIHGFRESDTGQEHVVLSIGDLATGDEPPLVRVHSECMTGEVFGSLRCDCRPQLESAM